MLRPGRNIYYGWFVLAAVSGIGFANAVTSIGVLTVFVVPLSEELDWTRTQVSGATSVGAILGALTAVFIGRLSDRLGARVILTTGGVLIVLATLYLALIQSLLGFYLGFGLARLSDQGLVQSVAPPTVAKWFLRYRGRALGILFFATSVGGVVMPLLTQFVIEQWSWRVAWVVLSGAMLLVGAIPCALLVRRQPEDLGLLPDGRRAVQAEAIGSSAAPDAASPSAAEGQPTWRLGEAIRSSTLWLLLFAAFMGGVGSTGIGLHLVPYLTQQGLGAIQAVGAVSVGFLAGAVGNMGWGFLTERLSARYLLAVIYLARAGSVALLLAVSSPIEAYAFAVLRGVAEGGAAAVTVVLLAQYYGSRHLGAIYGVNRAVQVLGFALGPIVAGLAYDVNGSYRGAFASFLFITAASALLVAVAKRPHRWPMSSDAGRE
jgi:OFA family oxalate/formate antiporter-like MFS transporter